MLGESLREGLAALSLELDEAGQALLLEYLALLDRWNRHFNLTAVRDPREMVTRHVLDSLAVLPHLRGQRFIDVGSGAGLPGIPLAIAAPDRHFTLLDSNGKKTRFLVQATAELELTNTRIVKQRVGDFSPEALYDGVLSRAFASLGDMMANCRHLLAPEGEFLAMKGQYPQEELRDLNLSGLSVSRLAVPGLEGDRCLLRFRPDSR